MTDEEVISRVKEVLGSLYDSEKNYLYLRIFRKLEKSGNKVVEFPHIHFPVCQRIIGMFYRTNFSKILLEEREYDG